MRSRKPLLYTLAGAWLALLLLEKAGSTAGSMRTARSAAPLRLWFKLGRTVKAVLLATLATCNLFLVINMAEKRKSL
jgi:hypothetical protein